MDKTVLLGVPIHDREWILPLFLEKVIEIDYPKDLITIYFLVNNCDDGSLGIVKDFKSKHDTDYKGIIIEIKNSPIRFKDERSTETRMKHTYSWLSTLRNMLLTKCVETNSDFLLSLDSDIIVEKDILKNLLSSEKDICSSLIYNGWMYTPDKPFAYPNILNLVNGNWKHIVSFRTKFPYKNEPNTIIEVGMTGAISIISKEVCKKARYSEHIVGEDCAFSISALENGFKSYCNISQLSHHIMSEKHLERYLSGEMYFWFD